ncbi:MAG TPA: sulfatase [Anaerohalosphaeraceae bacterium]|nr:sulfatase [Anaerohalosphaeraceae bacterium]
MDSITRRSFIKGMACTAAFFTPGCVTELSDRPRTDKKPNILLFLVDDMGWQDTSVPFHTEWTPFNRRYRTPSMERLAGEGVKFTQAYACCVCSPTRISLMTGQNAARHRVTNWTLHKNTSNDSPHDTLDFPPWNVNGLSPVAGVERTVAARTFPQLLQQAGYHTIHVGKAHFAARTTPGEDPRTLGFDVNIAGHAAGAPGSYLGTANFGNKPGEHTLPWGVPGLEKYYGQDIFLTEALTIEAIRAMDQAVDADKPFFLYMSHYAVHTPFARDRRFIQNYVDAGLDSREAMYAAMIEGMDKSLGDLMANLKRHHIENQTIILFMSDNGGLSAAGRGGVPHTHNRPLSSGKGSSHEGGVRVPMIVKWPGVTRPDSSCDKPVIIEDFFPTILEMAGAESVQQGGAKIDGVSFVPLLKNRPGFPETKALIWHFPNHWGHAGPGIDPHSAIRKGDYKLIYYHAARSFELFDIAQDIGETRNVFDSRREIAKQLADELAAFLKETQAQMPVVKGTSEPVPLPDALF